jgi:hypothetical protein
VIVGAPGTAPSAEGPRPGVGHAYVVFGSHRALRTDVGRLGTHGIVLRGRKWHFPDAFGWSVSGAGDVNRDGRDDVTIAAPGNQGFEDEYTRGSAYVTYGRKHGTVDMADPRGRGFRFGIGSPGDVLSVAGAGDVDGDGYGDVVAGDHGYRGTGAAYLAYGGRRGTVLISGTPRGADLGYSVAGGGDFDGDGLDDMVLSEPQAHRNRVNQAAGGAWLIRGAHRRGAIDARKRGIELRGSAGDWAGFTVALGRVDGDRLSDVVTTERGSLAVVAGNRHPGPVALPSGAAWLLDGTIEENPGFSMPDAGGFTTAGILGGGRHDFQALETCLEGAVPGRRGRDVGVDAVLEAEVGDEDGDGVVGLVAGEVDMVGLLDEAAAGGDTLWRTAGVGAVIQRQRARQDDDGDRGSVRVPAEARAGRDRGLGHDHIRGLGDVNRVRLRDAAGAEDRLGDLWMARSESRCAGSETGGQRGDDQQVFHAADATARSLVAKSRKPSPCEHVMSAPRFRGGHRLLGQASAT